MGRKRKAPEAEPAEAAQTATAEAPATAAGGKVNISEMARQKYQSGITDVNAIIEAMKAEGVEASYQNVYTATKKLREGTTQGQEGHGRRKKGQEGHGRRKKGPSPIFGPSPSWRQS